MKKKVYRERYYGNDEQLEPVLIEDIFEAEADAEELLSINQVNEETTQNETEENVEPKEHSIKDFFTGLFSRKSEK